MAWVIRNGKRYYYRSRFVAGKTVRTYFGRGIIARLAEECDLLARETRLRIQAEAREWLDRFRISQRNLHRIQQQIEDVLRIHLVAEGYYLHNRSTWRKRMKPNQPNTGELKPTPNKLTLRELGERADAGDEQALARLRQFLRENPKIAVQLGNVAGQAQETLLQRIKKADQLAGESVRVALDELRKELLPPGAGPLQRLAVDRIVLIHLEIYLSDALYPLVSELEPQQARVVAKAKDSAQRRYGLAMKTLAVVNRLVPAGKRRNLVVDANAPVMRVFKKESK